MLIVNTWRDPYDSGFSPTKPKQIIINPGLTVLVGCNGAGKTTLLMNIAEEMKIQRIPYHKYDNLRQGGFGSIFDSYLSGSGDDGDLPLGIAMFSSSEGENIKANIGRQSKLYKEFFKSGFYKDRDYRFGKLFDKAEEEITTNKRVLLFDAVDSGLSVDSVVEIVEFFNLILSDAEKMGIELYLVISANEYELCRNNQCFDVNNGKYLTFTDYEDYRKFILNSREKKEKRIEQQKVFYQKKKEKAARDIKELTHKIEKIKSKKSDWKDDWKIRDYEQDISDIKRKYGL